MTSTPAIQQQVAAALSEATGPEESLYAVLDAARHRDVPALLLWAQAEHECLYTGETREKLWYVAPYLVRCEPETDLYRLLLSEGWGQSWGIYCSSAVALPELAEHFRRFLIVEGEEEKQFYFRFYDPRVLRVYLPTCTAEEAADFFGPVSSFLLEAEEPETLLKFTNPDERLQLQTVSLLLASEESVS